MTDEDWKKRIRVYHICSNCKKEYIVVLEIGSDISCSLSVCPQCKQQDDLFIKISMEQEKFAKDDHGFAIINSKDDLKEYLKLHKEKFKSKSDFLSVLIKREKYCARIDEEKVTLMHIK